MSEQRSKARHIIDMTERQVVVTPKDIEPWRSQYNKLIKDIRKKSKYRYDKVSDIGADYSKLRTAFKRYFINLQKFLRTNMMVYYIADKSGFTSDIVSRSEFAGSFYDWDSTFERSSEVRRTLWEWSVVVFEAMDNFAASLMKKIGMSKEQRKEFYDKGIYKNADLSNAFIAKHVEKEAKKRKMKPQEYFDSVVTFGDFGKGIESAVNIRDKSESPDANNVVYMSKDLATIDIDSYSKNFWLALNAYMKKYLKVVGDKKLPKFEQIKPEIEVGGLRFINDWQRGLGPDEKQWKWIASEAKKATDDVKKYMPEVLYGDVYIRYIKNITGGVYKPSSDIIWLHTSSQGDFSGNSTWFYITLIHELAHRYYYKFMTESQRDQYEEFVRRYATETVTDYAKTSPVEDFAETMAFFIMSKGYMKSKDARDRLQAILKGKKVFESKARQFLNLLPEAKKETDPSLKPPKEWWDKMFDQIKTQRKKKKYSVKRQIISAIIGHIWYHNLSDEKRTEIRSRYGKTYGAAAA